MAGLAEFGKVYRPIFFIRDNQKAAIQFLKVNLKQIKHPTSTVIMLLHKITGPMLLATPYTIQTRVLVKTIRIMVKLRSPTLFVFQALYTCGKKVMALKKLPKQPTISTQESIKIKFTAVKLSLSASPVKILCVPVKPFIGQGL